MLSNALGRSRNTPRRTSNENLASKGKLSTFMCNGNKLMQKRVIRSESWLAVVEKIIFINEIIDIVKDKFFKDFRAEG